MSNNTNNRPLRDSLEEYARGVAGGLLFSFPLLYTMEVWWAGFIVTPGELLILVLFIFFLLTGYNRYAGMHPGVSWRDILVDSVEEMGIGLLLSFLILLMLNRINFNNMALDEILGKVVIEAMAVSVGVSIGTAQLGIEEPDNETPEEEEADSIRESEKPSKLSIVVLGFCGSIIVGGNVAPTEEIIMLGVGATPFHVLLMAMTSLFLCVLVLYFSHFKGTPKYESNNMLFHVVSDTCLCYLIALSASACALWFFGRFDNVSFWVAFSQVIALGVLSSLGASAGRLLIK